MGNDSDVNAAKPSRSAKPTGAALIDEITFDEQDQNLFLVEDARLRADALKHSILPRLNVVMREAASCICEIYGVDVFEDSTISSFPSFRMQRYKGRELKYLYKSAFVGLGGQRKNDKWFGLERSKGKPSRLIPFRYAFQLHRHGLHCLFERWWPSKINDQFNRKLLSFIAEHLDIIQSLCFETEMSPGLTHGEDVRYLSPLRDYYRLMIAERTFDRDYFHGTVMRYPVGPTELQRLIYNYVIFFPIYDSFVQIAKGEHIRLAKLLTRANDLLEAESPTEMETDVSTTRSAEIDLDQVAEAAERRVSVMPAIRWRVFQRDQWRCVSCGRGAHDDIILHVDHILPRSKGGADDFDNYQTLCSLCNSGKSNRDATNLRQPVRKQMNRMRSELQS
jgi:5-methylcytosine-specific restriction endonuclease McrA